MDTNEFLRKFKVIKIKHYTMGDMNYSSRELTPRMALADGLTLSVQVSRTHYCSPRDDDFDYYGEVEIGFPSEQVDGLMKYAETPENPTGTVYAYVPVFVLDEIIEQHGGIVGIETFVRHEDGTHTKVTTKFDELKKGE
jgi:hypothetical protein